MSAALATEGLGKRYGVELGAARLHARDPGGLGHRAGRPERRRQDDAAPARGRPDRAERGRGARLRPLAAARRRRRAAARRLRRAGSPALQGLHDRRDAEARPQAQPELGRRRSPRADRALGLPLGKKVGKLSGGQQAQVALTLALAKRPELLLLDEPVASLDPLARREFLQSVMEAVAETGMTVILSSHIVADLERVCDHLVILSKARVQLAGPIDEIVASHRLLTGPRTDPAAVARMHDVIRESHTERQTTLLVRANGHVYDSSWELHEVDLEEIVLAYLGRDGPTAAGAREAVRA